MLQKELQTLSFIAAGDTMLGSSTDPFRYVREMSRQTDIFHLNLETTLGPVNTPQISKAVRLNSPLSDIEWLLQLHPMLILNVANNHILDFGIDALRQTIDNLLEKNIKVKQHGLLVLIKMVILLKPRLKEKVQD
jgi:poly-gamma-glutamate synthesis protein (capsule biosynthesis protein)